MDEAHEMQITDLEEILTTHLKENYPQVNMPCYEIRRRAEAAAEQFDHDELNTEQVIESAMMILLKEYE